MNLNPPELPPEDEPLIPRPDGGGMVLKVGLVAFAFGLFLHGCVALSVLDGGSGGNDGAAAQPIPTRPPATPSPTALPDRTACNEIRGTAYRSERERQFFLANCLTPTP